MPEQKSEELSCVLRTLTICDGQEVIAAAPRRRTEECYCALLAAALRVDDSASAGEWRTVRARAVARASDTMRVVSQRERFRGPQEGTAAAVAVSSQQPAF